jgi:hypothetical protein
VTWLGSFIPISPRLFPILSIKITYITCLQISLPRSSPSRQILWEVWIILSYGNIGSFSKRQWWNIHPSYLSGDGTGPRFIIQ